MTGAKPPVPNGSLTRVALERVLARAAELQARSGDGDDDGAMSEKQLLELGRDVGLSAESLRHALAEERARTVVPEPRGLEAILTGAATVTTARTVPGTTAQVMAALDTMMQRDEALQVKRRFTDQLVWEARRDVFSLIRTGLKLDGRGYELTGASDVSAVTGEVEAERTHVRLVANFSEARERRAKIAVASVAGFLLTGVPLLAIGVAPLLAAVPPLLLSAAALSLTRRSYRKLLTRALVAMEKTLDRLEFGDAPRRSNAQAIVDAITDPLRLPGNR